MTQKIIALALFGAAMLHAQATIKWTTCAETEAAYGEHVRFTTEERLQLILNQNKAHAEYREWEIASATLDWFSGPKRVSLAMVKKHMPRAMLLRLRFPVDQYPHVDPKGLAELIDAEAKYEKAEDRVGSENYAFELIKKYKIGPGALFDPDMGGATPMSDCRKWVTTKPETAKR